jgi:hypothetical protein
VLREILTSYDVEAVGRDHPKVRNITSVPRHGSRIRVTEVAPSGEEGHGLGKTGSATDGAPAQ